LNWKIIGNIKTARVNNLVFAGSSLFGLVGYKIYEEELDIYSDVEEISILRIVIFPFFRRRKKKFIEHII